MASWQFVYAKRFAFYPPDYEDPGLGGSEGILVVLTRSLARRGHAVTVYNCCYRPGVYDDVRWRPVHELPDAPDSDVRVAVRHEESIAPGRNARTAFWMLDNRPEGVAAFLDILPQGRVVVASEAMRKVLGDALGAWVPMSLIPFPVETYLYEDVGSGPTQPPVCLFTSIPDRGLDVLLKIWPRIHQAVPTAQLHVSGGYELWGFTRAEAKLLAGRITEVSALVGGVQHLGVVNRRLLRKAQQRAWLLLYPCREQEMFCLAVAECAAAGTPAVTSSAYALSERVVNGVTGILVAGDINDTETQEAFVARTVELLRDPLRLAVMGRAARAHAQSLCADHVARQWEECLLG